MKFQDLMTELRKDPEFIQAEKDLRFNIRLANAVLYARMAKGWSQSELARQVHTRQANISRIEASLANPTLDLIHRLCDALDLDLIFSGPGVPEESASPTFPAPQEALLVDEIADKLAREWQGSGESLESMLSTLREVRAEYDAKSREVVQRDHS